ncbi:sugar phosphate isomerase/epimerase [Paenibacillus shirakamiensis]|uniref:Sugar phosphate isomerase/epimerase n=1 Tax=Paenibacillus shirakamiensis TaxID=1265935 RepID=A0ABS4JJT1_9BACL|nr:TIM barrel protein [Paenibacillus shirakamiensis]MBP2001967.1 sugar phosphate isomerase/epimerase [Paenibacillus shirakamiensis]
MKVAIGGYSFNHLFLEGSMDIFGYLETVKYRYRLDAVDLWNAQIAERTLPFLTLFDDQKLRLIRLALEERELPLLNIAVDTAHIWDPNPEVRERLHQNALAHLRASVLLGAQSVRIDTGAHGDSEFSDEAFDFIAGRYREYCAFAAEHGMRLGPENHMGPSLVPSELVRLAKAVDEPNFGVLLHMNRWSEDRECGDESIAPWVYHVHFDAKTAVLDDAANKVNMLKDAGYEGYWSLEHNAPADRSYIETEYLLSRIKKHLADADLLRQTTKGVESVCNL